MLVHSCESAAVAVAYEDRARRRLSLGTGRMAPLFVPPPLSAAMHSWARVVRALLSAHRGASGFGGGWNTLLFVRTAAVFSKCTAREVSRLNGCATVRHVPRYTTLFRQGSLAHSGQLLLLLRGSVRLQGLRGSERLVHSPSELALRIGASRPIVFGLECAAADAQANGRRRPDTCITLTPCVLICLQPADVSALVREQCRVLSNQRLLRELGLSAFKDLSETNLRLVSALFEFRFAPAGEVIAREGEAADSFFLLVHGSLSVSATAGGGMGGQDRPALIGRVSCEDEFRSFAEAPFTEWIRTRKHSHARRTASYTAEEPCW